MPLSARFVVRSTMLLLAVGFSALLGIIGMTIWLGERAQFFSIDAAEARDIRITAVELRSALQNAESSQRGFLVGGNEIYLAPYDNAKTLIERQIRKLTQLLSLNSEASPMVRRLSDVVNEKIAEMEQTIALKKNLEEGKALALFGTNRGKSLSDEANLFLSSIIRNSDDRLTSGATEQRKNAIKLRWVSILGGALIVIVVGGVAFTIFRYATEVADARDKVRAANASLENRVKERTADLGRARDRAETLLSEVNHRVANSLALVASLVRLQSRAVKDPAAKGALEETEARIYAVSMVHKRLYSSGDALLVALDEYLGGLLDQLNISMRKEGNGTFLQYSLEPLRLHTDATINLGVVVNEWVTNAVKYAYPKGRGEVRVQLKRLPDGRGELIVEDDGVGRSEKPVSVGTGLGSRVVDAMAGSIGGAVEYYRRKPGTGARLTFPLTMQDA